MSDQKQVLIVDDTEDSVLFLSEILEEHGYQYQVARNGKEALAAMEECRPDLVLLDLMMPRKSGIFVMREMRKNPGLRNVPVIVVTGASEVTGVNIRTGEEQSLESYADQYERGVGSRYHDRLKNLAPDDIVEKPIDPDILVKKIKDLIETQPWHGDNI